MGHQAIAGPVTAILQFLLVVINELEFCRGHPAVFMNLKQIVNSSVKHNHVFFILE